MDVHQPLVEFFKALAHPVRLQILEILAQEEVCVCHIMAILRQRQPYISQQLRVLRDAGLVKDRREGLTVYYQPAGRESIEAIDLARRLLQKKGMQMDSLTIPPAPIQGCNCPRCRGAAEGP